MTGMTVSSQKTREIHPMLCQRWATVYDAGNIDTTLSECIVFAGRRLINTSRSALFRFLNVLICVIFNCDFFSEPFKPYSAGTDFRRLTSKIVPRAVSVKIFIMAVNP